MLSRTLNNRQILIPLIGAVGAFGGISLYRSFNASNQIANETGKTFTNPNEWIDLTLKQSINVGKNSKKLVFALKDPEHVSGLVTASCVLTKFVTAKGNNVIRPYTPINDVNEKGEIEFIIKKYEGGKMSTHIHDLKPEDTLSFKGPIIKWKWEANQYKSIYLIGGGTGITPLYQLIREITADPEDKTQVTLFYGSVDADDILLRKQLDDLSRTSFGQFKVEYFLDKAPENWTGHNGFIDKDFLSKALPGPSKDSKVFVCGPPGLYKAISGPKNSPTDQGEVTGILADLGYTKEHVYKF